MAVDSKSRNRSRTQGVVGAVRQLRRPLAVVAALASRGWQAWNWYQTRRRRGRCVYEQLKAAAVERTHPKAREAAGAWSSEHGGGVASWARCCRRRCLRVRRRQGQRAFLVGGRRRRTRSSELARLRLAASCSTTRLTTPRSNCCRWPRPAASPGAPNDRRATCCSPRARSTERAAYRPRSAALDRCRR